MTKPVMPKYAHFYLPVLHALREIGGSGTIAEINQRVLERMDLPEEILGQMHDPEKSNYTEVEYRLAWTRTNLRFAGLLENSSRGVWALTKAATEEMDSLDVGEIRRRRDEAVKTVQRQKARAKREEPEGEDEGEVDDNDDWRAKLFQILTKNLDPSAFERLIQRLLREAGFIQVEVTGRSGDGGIDGKGIARIHGLMSFHVVFQAKRYQGVVSASQIRDFRGAMVGRTDKGLFITTGRFSADAQAEATRDGAPPIDLISGDGLAEKLKELRLGVTVEMVESVSVDEGWFSRV